MTIKRFNLGSDFTDGLSVFDSFFTNPTFSMIKGEFYDPEKFDLVPKKSYSEQQLKYKQKCLEELKERRKGDMIQYDEREKELKLEIDQLKQKLNAP